MLHFGNNNIYYSFELSNDIVDEIWTTDFPACVNDSDADGIYEGVKLHKFDTSDFVVNPDEFFKSHKNIAFTLGEMSAFLLSWYSDCVTSVFISNVVDMQDWIDSYIKCYEDIYCLEDIYEGASGYFDAIAAYRIHAYLHRTQNEPVLIKANLGKTSFVPEVSWMLADYLHDKKSLWKDYLTEYIRKNIKDILYKRVAFNRAHRAEQINIPLDSDLTIDDIDFSNSQSVFYFDNPFDVDFHTNYKYIQYLINRYKVDVLKS